MTATLLGNIKGPKGDTGKGIQSITKTGTSGLVDTYTITYTNGDTTTYTLTNAPSPGTFTDLQNAINQSGVTKLILDKDYKYDSTTDSSLTNGIVVNKTITIIGNGHIIDGNNSKRAFHISGQYTVNLYNLRIQNCTMNKSGGVIYADNGVTVNITNTTFNQNNATGTYGNGGVIFAASKSDNTTININNTQFTNNTASCDGGAIYAGSNSIMVVSSSLFMDNTASNYANIYCSSATTVYNCDINDISTTCYNVTNKNYLTDHQSIPSASTSTAGTVQLEDSYSSTSTTKTPTSNALKTGLATKADIGHTHNYASISDIDVEIEAYLDAIIDALEEAEIIGGGNNVDISTQWSTPLSDSKVPSEKLVKELLDTKANSSSIPTKTSDLTNDSGFLTSHQDISGKLNISQTNYKGKNVVVDSSSGDITFENKPTIPTKTSDLTNDSGYVTSSGSTVSYSQTQSSGTNTYTIGKITINGTSTTLYGKDTNTTYTIPSASTSTPAQDTTNGTYGSGTAYARANHAHPKSSLYAEAEHEHDTDDIDGLINLIYPVGSIYINMVDQTSPATKFPGTTWDRITNRFIYGCADGEAGLTGGEATHTLTVNEMPSHTHKAWTKAEAGWAIWGQRSGNLFSPSSYTWEGSNVNVSDIDNIKAEGGGAAHNNMPPYVKAYMWVRVS